MVSLYLLVKNTSIFYFGFMAIRYLEIPLCDIDTLL